MKYISRYKHQIICICVVCALFAVAVAAKDVVRIEPLPVPLAETMEILDTGETVTLKFHAKPTDLYGYQFKLYFDDDALEVQSISSSISEISLIFHKPFSGYILVGATKTGNVKGYSAEGETQVCEVVLRAKKDGVSSNVSLQEVNTIDSQLTYTENVTGWGYTLAYA